MQETAHVQSSNEEKTKVSPLGARKRKEQEQASPPSSSSPSTQEEEEDVAPPLRFPDRGKVEMKRVSFYIPEPVFEDVQAFADQRGETMTGVFRWCLGVGKAIWDEVQEGHSVRIYSNDGKLVKELVFNPY